MANCEFYLELMSQSLDGELSQQAHQALKEHLNQCADCRFLYQQLQEVHCQLSSLEKQEVPEGFAQGVMDRVRTLEQQSTQPKIIPLLKRPQFRALGSIAACALLCLGIWRMDLSGSVPPGRAGADSAAPTENSNSVAVVSAAEPQAKLAGMPAANTPIAASESDMLSQAFSLTQNQLPDSAALLQLVTDALGTAPGALLVLEEIPQSLKGTWFSTADGLTVLEVQDEDRAALYEQLSPTALLDLTVDDGPLVLVHWS